MPDKFKAQVAASDRQACVLYQQYLTAAKTELIQELESKAVISKAPTSMQVRELGNRWGSCNPKGDIYFHWRVALLPTSMIEYVVVHEMLHIETFGTG